MYNKTSSSCHTCFYDDPYVCPLRYPEQESYPVNLKKDSYYYIEALHKEQYGNDSLAVAVKTPDNKFHAPIPSEYLWTLPPPKPHGMLSNQ